MKQVNNQAFSSKISRLVESNKITTALELLSKAAKQLSDESMSQEIILLSGRWTRLRSEKSKKTIRAEEADVRYNQISNHILNVSNEVVEHATEQGIALDTSNIAIDQTATNTLSRKRIIIYAVSVIGLILLIITPIYFFNSPKEVACPFPVESTNYHILLIPFEEMGLNGQTSNSPEGVTAAVQNRFESLKLNNKLPIDVRVDHTSKLNVQTLNPDHSWGYASDCHADLLLSGLFEQMKGVNIDSLIITFKYMAVQRDQTDSIFMTGMERHAVTSLSSLIHGSFPGKIEDIIYWALGIKEFEEENYAGAIQHFDAIRPENEQSQIKVELAKAEAVQRIGNYTEAFNRYKRLELQTDKLDIHQKVVVFNNLAALAVELDEPKVAAESMDRAIKLAPNNQVLRKNNNMIRDIQISRPRRDDDISESATNIQLMTSTRVISQRADASLISEEMTKIDTTSKESSLANEKAEVRQAQTPNRNLSMGIKARESKNYQSAIEHLSKVVEQAPTQYLAFLERGYSHAQLGHHQEALKDYQEALKLKPNSPDAFLRRGQLYRQMARYQAAIADFEKLRELGKNKEALTQMAFVYADMKSYQQAINVIDQVLLSTPRDQELRDFRRHLQRKAVQRENN